MNKKLASFTTSAHTYLAGVNPPVEIGLSNHKADKPLPSGFFSSVISTCSYFMVGAWWGHFVCAVFFVDGRPTLSCAYHPDWSLGCGFLTPHKEHTYHV